MRRIGGRALIVLVSTCMDRVANSTPTVQSLAEFLGNVAEARSDCHQRLSVFGRAQEAHDRRIVVLLLWHLWKPTRALGVQVEFVSVLNERCPKMVRGDRRSTGV